MRAAASSTSIMPIGARCATATSTSASWTSRACFRASARPSREDMSKRGMPREKVLATVVSLLDKTLIRVGNDGYARENGSYGLTTLRSRHLEVDGSEMRFHFKGKSGKTWRLSMRDRRIARIVRSIQDLPGQHLFQYLDDEGAARSINSADVNDYLREIAGADVSAKDFRTWAGTVLAVLALSALEAFTTQTQAKMNVRRAIEAVADKLGNTPTICRKCYIHPEIVACYMEGALPVVAAAPASNAASSALPREEAAVLRLLKRRLAPQRRPRRKPRRTCRCGLPLESVARSDSRLQRERRRSVRSEPLFERDRQSAQIRVRQQADLTAAQFQHGAFLVSQHDGAGTAADCQSHAGRAIDAGNVRRPLDVAYPSLQHGLRSAEDEAIVEPAGRQCDRYARGNTGCRCRRSRR